MLLLIYMKFRPWPLWYWHAFFSPYLAEAPWFSFSSHSLNHCHVLAWVWISMCYIRSYLISYLNQDQYKHQVYIQFLWPFSFVMKSQSVREDPSLYSALGKEEKNGDWRRRTHSEYLLCASAKCFNTVFHLNSPVGLVGVTLILPKKKRTWLVMN